MAETNTTTQPVVLQIPTTVKSLVEALIFGAREPLTPRQLQALYEEQGTEPSEPRKISYEEIAKIVEDLNGEYTATDRPYRIIQLAGGYQFATQPAYAEWLGKLYKEQSRRKLSQSSIETLAIIAYKQPITKPELEAIRGVNCDYVLKTLLEKDLATIVGRAPSVGRPLLYGTSKEFLKHFGLNDLNDLPRPREIQEIMGESQFESERRMLEAQQGLEEMKKEEDFKSRLPHIPKRKAGLDDDVKIIPRKRTREIKVRQPEEGEAVTPQETKEPETVTDSTAMASAVSPEEHDVLLPEASQQAAEGSVEFEGGLSDEGSSADAGVMPREKGMTPEESRYINLTQSPASAIDEIKPVEEVQEVQSTEEISLAPVVSVPAIESEIVEVPTGPEQPPIAQTEPTHALDAAVEPVAESESSAVQDGVFEDRVATDSPVETEKTVVQTPHVVSAFTEERPESVGHAESEEHHTEGSDAESGSQPKTRWKSWKEKIQGFIKKLFG